MSIISITPDNIVCRPCQDDVRRVTANRSHRPRWEKINHDVVKCCVKGCPDVCFVHSKVTDINTMKWILEDASLEIVGETIPFPTPLYNHPYYSV